MDTPYAQKYLTLDELIKKAKSKMPGFVFDYLEGGCNENICLTKNINDIRDIELKPYYLREHKEADLSTELFGHRYDAPFGVSPMAMQGLMWPNAPEILAKATFKHNIPFILSTLTTSSIERISEITEGRAWFQLYHPVTNDLRDDMIQRAEKAGCPVLVVISDIPTLAYRPKDIRNGIGLPPKKSINNFLQIMARPEWAYKTMRNGIPRFATMQPYMKALNNQLQFDNKMTAQKVAEIRDKWKGKLVLKGVASEEDAEMAVKLGLDGIILSNHGGRQLDAAQSSIRTLAPIAKNFQGKIKIMMDSGIRTGPDIARTLAAGSEFSFLGRVYMYAIAALGEEGGEYIIRTLKGELAQVMNQINCRTVADMPSHLITHEAQHSHGAALSTTRKGIEID